MISKKATTMKIVNSLMLIAVAAMAFTACSKDEAESVVKGSELTVNVIAGTPSTRTYIGEKNEETNAYPMYWAATGESVMLAEVKDNATTTVYSSKGITSNEEYTISQDMKTAYFSFNLTEDTTGATEFDYYVISPASAFYSVNTFYGNYNVTIPAEQTPTATSADPAASILVARAVDFTAQPTEFNLDFDHILGYGRMTIKGLEDTEANIKTVTLTATDETVNMAGGYYHYYGEVGSENTNYATNKLTFDMSALGYTTADEFDVWFATKPCDLSGGYTVTVVTDKGAYSRTVETTTLAFKKGIVSRYRVNMADATYIESLGWQLITDKSVLTDGAQVVIVSTDADAAVGAQDTYRRFATNASKGADHIISAADDIEIFNVVTAYDEDNDWTFYALQNTKSSEGTFLYAPTSTYNNLLSDIVSSKNSFWDITFAEGAATITNKANSRRLQYYVESSYFTTYTSDQGNVAMYLVKAGDNTTTPVFAATATKESLLYSDTSAGFDVIGNVAWTATITEGDASFENGTKTISGSNTVEEVVFNFAANTNTTAPVSYTVTVTTTEAAGKASYELHYTQAAAPSADTKYYVMVSNTEIPTDFSGKYLFAYDTNFVYGLSSSRLATSTSIEASDNKVESNETSDSYALTIAASSTTGYYTIMIDGVYLGWSSSTSFVQSSTLNETDNYLWSVSYDATKGWMFTNKAGGRYIAWYPSSKQFRLYASNNSNSGVTHLYKLAE